MSKSSSRTLFLLAILFWVIGGALLAYGLSATIIHPDGAVTVHAHPTWTAIGGIVFVVGSLLGLISWMGALARMAQLRRWVWFVCLIIFPGICLLLYIFFGPKTASRRAQGPMTMPPPTPSYGD